MILTVCNTVSSDTEWAAVNLADDSSTVKAFACQVKEREWVVQTLTFESRHPDVSGLNRWTPQLKENSVVESKWERDGESRGVSILNGCEVIFLWHWLIVIWFMSVCFLNIDPGTRGLTHTQPRRPESLQEKSQSWLPVPNPVPPGFIKSQEGRRQCQPHQHKWCWRFWRTPLILSALFLDTCAACEAGGLELFLELLKRNFVPWSEDWGVQIQFGN